MNALLSPKQVASAMAVSESSVKRWCDKGVIQTQYTAGGHRRVPLPQLIEFSRRGEREILHHEAIGLPALSSQSLQAISEAVPMLVKSILAGDEEQARRVIFAIYLAKFKISDICDQLVAAAFREIGLQWECGRIDPYQERQSCEIMVRTLNEIRQLTPAPAQSSPLAIGCPTPNDPFTLGSLMTELVLRDQNWRTVSLGGNLPWESLQAAIRDYQPRLFWLSCTSIPDESAFLDRFNSLLSEHKSHCEFVVGGRALTPSLIKRMRKPIVCNSMHELEQQAATIHKTVGNDLSARAGVSGRTITIAFKHRCIGSSRATVDF